MCYILSTIVCPTFKIDKTQLGRNAYRVLKCVIFETLPLIQYLKQIMPN